MKITVKNLQKKIPISPKRIKEAILEALSSQDIKKSGEITVCFVNDKKIRELNLKYHRRDASTDVLAFDISSPQSVSGSLFADIIVSTETAICNAKIYNTSPLYESCLYAVHGALHLLGYRDSNTKERELMQSRAEQILAKLKIKRES